MEKNNKIFTPIVIVSLVALLVTGGVSILNKNEFRSETTNGSQSALGAEITYPSALSHLETYNLFSAFLADITAVRTAGGGSLSTTTTWNPKSIATSTDALYSATTTVSIAGAVLGDQIVASLATSTSQDSWFITGKMVAATSTVLVSIWNTGDAALDIATTTLYVRAYPYTAAAALTVTATSTP